MKDPSFIIRCPACGAINFACRGRDRKVCLPTGSAARAALGKEAA